MNDKTKEQLMEEISTVSKEKQDYLPLTLIIVIILVCIVAYLAIKYFHLAERFMHETKKADVSDLAQDIIKFIKSQKGRVSQKDIRKKFPSSEAKISLVITELQHKGVVERIKKGRGNIIVLKK